MKPVDRTVAFIQQQYAAEGLEVNGHDAKEGCVWVALPPEVHNFSELLDELRNETDASCDIKLTETGATLTVWVATSWPDRGNAAAGPGMIVRAKQAVWLVLAVAVVVLATMLATRSAPSPVASPVPAPAPPQTA